MHDQGPAQPAGLGAAGSTPRSVGPGRRTHLLRGKRLSQMCQARQVQIVDRDWFLRQIAFRFLEDAVSIHGDDLLFRDLNRGIAVEEGNLTLAGQRGIWKPAVMHLPLSIRTGATDPYGDEVGDDGFLHYRYYGTDPQHPDNAGLRRCFNEGRPLIYFRALAPGRYSALWPVVIVNDDPGSLTFTLACEDVEALRPGVAPRSADAARRAYATRIGMVRLHQAQFRRRVLGAYRSSCTVCRLSHENLLDAAHIIPDRDDGEPVVSNGMAMCKIHHAAFDSNIMGIRPDLVVEIRTEILVEVDGPMLKHGLQELHHQKLLVIPGRAEDRPSPTNLERRYEEFRAAS